jgi:D-psicose/D-tagatose/L-ribulose 3-epimerase
MDFIEVALLDTSVVDAAHTRDLARRHDMRIVCSLGLPEAIWPSRGHVDEAVAHLTDAIETAAAMGAEALSGVTYGGIGERTGLPPTEQELSNVARALEGGAKAAEAAGIAFGIEPVNRYETHLINTARQAVEMVERVGQDIFVHLDTYHMNIEEKGIGQGVLDAREHIRYIHLSESDRGTPGEGCCDWDAVFTALRAIDFRGGLAMESFINMPPEVAYGLSVWRPVAESHEAVMRKGLPFLRNKTAQYQLVGA